MNVFAVPKPKKKKRGKSPHTKLVEEIDHIDSDICLITTGFRCLMCGGRASQTHHFFPKGSHGNVRFNSLNHIPLDFACHRRRVHDAGEVEEMRDKLIAKIGQEDFDWLKSLAYQRGDFTDKELKEELLRKKAVLASVVEKAPQEMREMMSSAAVARYRKALKKGD